MGSTLVCAAGYARRGPGLSGNQHNSGHGQTQADRLGQGQGLPKNHEPNGHKDGRSPRRDEGKGHGDLPPCAVGQDGPDLIGHDDRAQGERGPVDLPHGVPEAGLDRKGGQERRRGGKGRGVDDQKDGQGVRLGRDGLCADVVEAERGDGQDKGQEGAMHGPLYHPVRGTYRALRMRVRVPAPVSAWMVSRAV
jgi:hypothetical protein